MQAEKCFGCTALRANIRILQTYAENYIWKDNFIVGFQTSVWLHYLLLLLLVVAVILLLLLLLAVVVVITLNVPIHPQLNCAV